jgi:DNA primase
VVEAVRSRTDLVELVGRFLKLKKIGSRYVGLCPFHAEKTPSFNVNPQRGFFHCFGCQASGDAFTFLMKMEGKTFPEALEELAARAGVELPARQRSDPRARELRVRLLELLERAAGYYEQQLWGRAGEAGRAYLAERGLSEELARRFRLGFAPPGWDNLGAELRRQGGDPEDLLAVGLVLQGQRGGTYDAFRFRLMFPILGLDGKVHGFGARKLDPEDQGGKYINSAQSAVFDKGEMLYGLEQARAAIQQAGRAVLVEGYFDVLGLVAAGIEGVVAGCGTALTEGHARLLKRFCEQVVSMYDGDEAGQKAGLKAAEVLLQHDVAPYAVSLPPEHDPDTFVRAEGAERVLRLLAEARPTLEVIATRELARAGDDLEARGRGLRALLPMLAACQDGVRQGTYVRWLAERFRLSEADIRKALAARREARPREPARPSRTVAAAPTPLPVQELDVAVCLLVHPGLAAGEETEAVLRSFQCQPLGQALLEFLASGGQDGSAAAFIEAQPEWLRARLSEAMIQVEEAPLAELSEGIRKNFQRIRVDRLDVELEALQAQIDAAQARGDQVADLLRRKLGLNAQKKQLDPSFRGRQVR